MGGQVFKASNRVLNCCSDLRWCILKLNKIGNCHDSDAVRDELADLVIYVTRVASILGVDLIKEANAKIDRNEVRFPPTQ